MRLALCVLIAVGTVILMWGGPQATKQEQQQKALWQKQWENNNKFLNKQAVNEWSRQANGQGQRTSTAEKPIDVRVISHDEALIRWIEAHCVAVMPDQQIGGTLRLRCEEDQK
jgi:hypothetical protein